MNGDAFADAVAIANFHAGRFASIFQILVNFTDGSELIDLVVAANFGMTVDDNVRFQYGAFADFDVSANNTKRANVDVSANNGAFFYNGGRMNKGGFITYQASRLRAHIIVASQTTFPSTVATPLKRVRPRRVFSKVTSIII